MVVAITYEDGNVGAHFGHAKEFQLYELEGNTIVDEAVVGTYGSGHEAMVDFLLDYSTEILICQNIGDSAKQLLQQNYITICSGVTGPVDQALEDLLAGKLKADAPASAGNCSCGGDCSGGDCSSGSCGGCCG